MHNRNERIELALLSTYSKLPLSVILEFADQFTPDPEPYIKIIKDLSYRRKIINFTRKYSELAESEESDIDKLRNGIEKDFLMNLDNGQVQDAESIASILNRYFEEIVSGEKNKVIKTYIRAFDSVILGFRPGDLVVIAARPGAGKTSFLVQLANNIALNKKKIAIFSIEMTKKQIATRMLSNLSAINQMAIRNGKAKDKIADLADYCAKLANTNVFIDEKTNTLTGIKSSARRLKKRENIELIGIDYLQLIQHHGENRNVEVGNITKELKALAKELGIPVLLLSQLNRANEMQKDKRPLLSHLRESGSIEQDADVVLFIHRDDYYEKNVALHNHEAEIIVAKNRDGPTGTIKLKFKKETMAFSDIEIK